MLVQFGPNSIDEPNLLYKLHRKLKVFNTIDALPKRGYNLVASTSKYGLVFITTPEGMLCVYYLKQLIDKECEPQHITIPLPMHPTHIAVNCNQEWLAVISGPLLLVYKCLDFQNQDVKPSVTMQLQINPSVFVSSLQWNPCIPDTIGIVFFDGTLLVSQVSTMQVKKIQSNARCLCWSPKGKQLVTGNSDGTLSQYKPDLSPMKMIPSPNLFENDPVEVLAIYWISTYQFAVSFRNSSNNSRPAVAIVNTPKGGSPSCFNYEDICYSTGSNRPWYYYLIGLTQWNLILSASSNSMEIATLASVDGANWAQWCQSDEARPELPLTDRKQENYPVGICVDTAAVHQLPWGENEVLPPMPLLHVVSQTGLLSIFNIINLNKQSPQLCTPPQQLNLPEPGLTRDVPGKVQAPPPTESIPQPKPQIQQVQQAPQQLQPSLPQQPQQPQPVQLPPQPVQQLQQPIIVPKAQIQQPAMPTSTSATSASLTVIKSTTPVSSEAESSVKPSQIQVPKSQTASAAVNAALKQEQERISKAKAEQELKQMLIKEVNDFQMELYRFMKSTREKQDMFDRELQSAELDLNIDLDPKQLKKECEIEDLCETITQLKLDLVRACAVVAETRAHAEANELQDWRQADPLTTKRLASIKKMIYYAQNQLDQSRKAMDFKWNDISTKKQYSKPGERMIRPILDDVYQPLVKQQEILCRQQAVLRTLRNTFNECNLTPVAKTTSLLRSTPFRNKDPLSKLTKNILNMSIEPQTKSKNQLLCSQKLDALRDLLSNHKPIKIKPVNVELRQHLETLKKRYEKSLKEKNEIKEVEKIEIIKDISIPQKIEDNSILKPKAPIAVRADSKSIFHQNVVQPKEVSQNIDFKKETNTFGGNTFSFFKPKTEVPKPDIVKESPISVPTFASSNLKPKPNIQTVARTLFTDEPKEEKQTSHQQNQQQTKSDQQPNASENTKSLLRKLILKDSATDNVQENKTAEPKNDANTFMGQNICTPTAFGFSKPTSAPATSVFPKQTDMPKMFSKPDQPVSKQSDETGEHEARSPKPKDEKTMTNIFSMKPLSNKNQNVPDVIKNPNVGKIETKVDETPKQNLQEKPVEVKKEDLKPLIAPTVSKPQAQAVIVADLKKPAAEAKIENFSPVIFKTSEATTDPLVPTTPQTQTSAPNISASNEEKSKPLTPVTAGATVTASENEPKTEKASDETKPTDLSKSKSDTTTANATPTPNTTSIVAILSPPPNVTVTSGDKPAIFSTPSSTSIFDTANKPSFGNQPSAFVPNTASSVFATASAAAFGQAPAFGTTQSVFGTTTTATTSQSVIGKTPTTAATSNIFGTATTTTTQSLFGGTSSAQSLFSAAASKSLFGTTQASTPSIFRTSTAQPPVFGSTPSVFSSTGFGTPSTQASLFSSTATSQASVFGTPTTTQSSVFGSSSTQTSVFGSPTTTQASLFGSPATTQSSVFGSTNVSQPSVFGTTTTQSSLFGGNESNIFAAANISTTSAPSQSSGGNIFGGSSGSVFGNNNASNIFGGKSAFGSSTFGQNTSTDFWSGGDKSGSSAFGTSTFGQQSTTQSPSVFGTGSFSAPSAGGAFGSPGSSVFGTPTQQTATAFGGSPVFGSKPVFGGSPSFGAPSFGSGFNKSPSGGFGAPASFGGGGGFGNTAFGNASPNKMFGNSSPGFGSQPQQSSPTFENLATQNTLTFGNLAQQSGQPGPQAPSFNTSPSFTGWRVPTSQTTSAPNTPALNEGKSKTVPHTGNELKTEANVSALTKRTALSKSKPDTTTTTTAITAVLPPPPIVTTSGDKSTEYSTPTLTSIFDTATEPIFGNQPYQFVPNTVSSVFASFPAALEIRPSTFGTTTTATTGQNSTTATTQSLFGGISSAQSLFSAAASKSLFGTTQASTPSIFGTTQSLYSILHHLYSHLVNLPVSDLHQPSVFGFPSTLKASVFGAPATRRISKIGPATPVVFGSTTTTQASLFGSSPTTQSSVFGSTNVSQPSVFSTPTTTQSPTTTLFGRNESNTFSATNISTTSTPSQSSGGNIFGGSTSFTGWRG